MSCALIWRTTSWRTGGRSPRRFSARSADISSGDNHSSANDASRSMIWGRSSRYRSQLRDWELETGHWFTISKVGKRVAPKNAAWSELSHRLAPGSSGKSAAMQSSRWVSIEPTSRSTRIFEAATRFEWTRIVKHIILIASCMSVSQLPPSLVASILFITTSCCSLPSGVM